MVETLSLVLLRGDVGLYAAKFLKLNFIEGPFSLTLGVIGYAALARGVGGALPIGVGGAL